MRYGWGGRGCIRLTRCTLYDAHIGGLALPCVGLRESFLAKVADLLLDKEYLPSELPGCFSSSKLAQTKFYVDGVYKAGKGYKEIRSGRHSNPRDSVRRRSLALVNPVGYAPLVEEISDGYKDIFDFCKGSTLSKSPVRSRGITLGRVSPDLGKVRFSEWQRPFLASAKYVLSLDINRFYQSIYTHSLPWALHSKAVAKLHPKDTSLLGNRLDVASRRLQSSQTIGLPIGPSTSFVLSEIISTAIENVVVGTLVSDDVRGYRYLETGFWSLAIEQPLNVHTLQLGERRRNLSYL